MKNTIFVLQGKSNTGKTQTIKEIYNLLHSQYFNTETTDYITPVAPDFDIFGVDIRTILKINNINIGFESQGDPNSRLEDSLKFFIEKECKIIICGARTRGMTNDWIKQYSNSFEIQWIEKIISKKDNEILDNQKQAEDIVKKINTLIDDI